MVILTSLGICALIFGLRYMRNRENMAMIEKGLNPKVKPTPRPYLSLKWGLLLLGVGLGLFVAYLLDHTLLYQFGHDHDEINGGNVPIFFALIVIGGGLGLITSYRIEKKEVLDKER
jgi:hypothetical protein